MSTFPGFECSVCGALKRDVNHWWLVSIVDVTSAAGLSSDLMISQWQPDLAAHKGRRPACGSNCAQKLVERWLTSGTLDAPRGAAGNPVEAHK